MSKNDYVDAFVIADFARVGKITSSPWRGSQFLALQRLTRHRLHLAKSLTSEKTYMLSNVFLKFSELPVLEKDSQPFSDKYGATAASVLTDFLSTDEIADMSLDDLVDFIRKKGKNRFSEPDKTAELLQKAARDSYKLDKCLYEPLTIAPSSSFNVIKAYSKELKAINSALLYQIPHLFSYSFYSHIRSCILKTQSISFFLSVFIFTESYGNLLS